MDIVNRLRTAVHLESAAIAPQTSALIELAREAASEIERLQSLCESLADDNIRILKEYTRDSH